MEETNVDSISQLNFRAYSELDYEIFKDLFDPRSNGKVTEGKLSEIKPSSNEPKATASDVATFQGSSSIPEFQDLGHLKIGCNCLRGV